jgi:hypothetical protein
MNIEREIPGSSKSPPESRLSQMVDHASWFLPLLASLLLVAAQAVMFVSFRGNRSMGYIAWQLVSNSGAAISLVGCFSIWRCARRGAVWVILTIFATVAGVAVAKAGLFVIFIMGSEMK